MLRRPPRSTLFPTRRSSDLFEKTLGQWIDSSGHRKNLLLHNASRVGIASAKNASGKRTYWAMVIAGDRSEEHTSELQSRPHLVCRLLLEKKKNKYDNN